MKNTKKHGQNTNLFTILACVILPPVGIYMVWKRKWSMRTKYALTAVATVVMALVVAAMPMADRKVPGGVTLVGNARQAEVYGPELPQDMVPGHTVTGDSVVTVDDGEEEEITYYYAAKGEKFYHEYTCSKAYASSQKLTLYEVYYLGYRPCQICNPPTFDAGEKN